MIITAIKIICIILAIVLIVLVILQQGKGSDLGSAFGGGSSNSMFGAVGPSNFLGKLTAFIATLFLILNLAQAVLLKNANTEVLFTDEEIQEATKTTEMIKAIYVAKPKIPDSASDPKYSLCALPRFPKLVEIIVLSNGF